MTHIVLFVDDDIKVLDSLRRMLRNEPYEIVTATTALEALSIMNALEVDVLVTDEQMPLMNGTELLSLARKRSPEMRRVMLTGKGSLTTAMKAVNEGGVSRFLTKPADHLALAVVLRELLAERTVDSTAALIARGATRHHMLALLETTSPGITHVERDAQGAVVVDEEDLNTTISK